MKKPFLFLLSFVFAASAYGASSTCQQRVDRNLDKTTNEKVVYCLYPGEEQLDDSAVTRVLYTRVDTLIPPVRKEKSGKVQKPKKNAKKYSKKWERSTANLDNASRYPEFRNDILSSQDHQIAEEAASDAIGHQVCDENGVCTAGRMIMLTSRQLQQTQKLRVKKISGDLIRVCDENGVCTYVRRNSLGEAWAVEAAKKCTIQVERQEFLSDELLECEGFAVLPVEPRKPSEAEIAEAKRLENDPLYQNYTNGNSPDGFLSDDLLVREGFGHINTDPAFEQ